MLSPLASIRPPWWVTPTLLATVLLLAGPSRAAELTLGDVVRLALTRNERSGEARLSVVSAEASVRRARAGFLPTVSASGSETLRPYQIEQNGRTTTRSNAASGSLSVNQPLLSLTTFPLYSSAKHGLEATRFDEVEARRQLGFDAARAFFAVVTQQRVLAAATSRLERAESNLTDTRARAQAELVSTNDVTRSQVERASAVQNVANAQSALERARLSLAYLIDSPITGDITAPVETLAAFDLDLAHLLPRAINQRPDLAAAQESVSAASASADEPGLRFVPTLTAAAQARVADQPVVGDRYIDTLLTLNLNWAIWDAGVRGADAESRTAALQTSELQTRALRRQIQTAVRTAVSSLIAARASLAGAQEGVEAATRNVTETDVLYKQGLAKAIELVDANSSLFDADIALAAAQLDLRQAELDLRSALGLFPLDGVK